MEASNIVRCGAASMVQPSNMDKSNSGCSENDICEACLKGYYPSTDGRQCIPVEGEKADDCEKIGETDDDFGSFQVRYCQKCNGSLVLSYEHRSCISECTIQNCSKCKSKDQCAKCLDNLTPTSTGICDSCDQAITGCEACA